MNLQTLNFTSNIDFLSKKFTVILFNKMHFYQRKHAVEIGIINFGCDIEGMNTLKPSKFMVNWPETIGNEVIYGFGIFWADSKLQIG